MGSKVENAIKCKQVQSDVCQCRKGLHFSCMLMGSELGVMDQEWDLGVAVDSSMKMSTQCVVAVERQIPC